MARTALTKIQLPGGYTTTGVAVTYTAADVANGNSVALTGNEVILVKNVDGAASHNVTITGAADASGRADNLGPLSIPLNGIIAFQRFPLLGWQQTDGTLWISGDNVNIQFAVLQLN